MGRKTMLYFEQRLGNVVLLVRLALRVRRFLLHRLALAPPTADEEAPTVQPPLTTYGRTCRPLSMRPDIMCVLVFVESIGRAKRLTNGDTSVSAVKLRMGNASKGRVCVCCAYLIACIISRGN